MTTIPTRLEEIQAETTFLLPGPAGALEVLLSATPPERAEPVVALLCHPHPLHGGTMHNKVVTTLAKTFQQLNVQTLRFNFRGVGRSEGVYAEGQGELQDLYAVQAWVKAVAPKTLIWLAGFSFGAYISIRAATEKIVAGLVTIAPPVNHFPLHAPVAIYCPWLVVQGEDDEVVSSSAVLTWLETLNPQPRLLRFPKTGHFFHGVLTQLRETLVVELRQFL